MDTAPLPVLVALQEVEKSPEQHACSAHHAILSLHLMPRRSQRHALRFLCLQKCGGVQPLPYGLLSSRLVTGTENSLRHENPDNSPTESMQLSGFRALIWLCCPYHNHP